MIILPPVHNYTYNRPGGYTGSQKRLVPDLKKCSGAWKIFYDAFRKSGALEAPVNDFRLNRVNPYFGYFGKRFHPSKLEPYFHIGLDISGNTKNIISPVADGTLEYSGRGITNGNYVLLKHDNIQTEDGYVLYSMYAHMKDYKVGFTTRQKMLREISLHTHPEIHISKDTTIGTIGNSGNLADKDTHLHLQLELRRGKETPIVIDPIRAFGYKERINKTAGMRALKDFNELYKNEKPALKQYNLLAYWQ